MNNANGSRYATRMDGDVRRISILLSWKKSKRKNKRKKKTNKELIRPTYNPR